MALQKFGKKFRFRLQHLVCDVKLVSRLSLDGCISDVGKCGAPEEKHGMFRTERTSQQPRVRREHRIVVYIFVAIGKMYKL